MYQLLFLTSAKREFKKLDTVAQNIIKDKLISFSKNPNNFKNNIKALQGAHKGKFRLRIANYRVILKKEDDKLIVTVISVGHRKNIYEKR